MFIATAMENQFKLRRSEMKTANTLRSYGAIECKQPGVYKHFIPTGLMSPRNLLKQMVWLATQRPQDVTQKIAENSQSSEPSLIA